MMGSDDEDADHEGQGHHEMMGDSYGMEGSPGDEVCIEYILFNN